MASNSFPFPTAPSNFGESVSAQAPGLDPNSNRSTSQSHTVELGHSPLDQQIPQAQDTTHNHAYSCHGLNDYGAIVILLKP